MEELNHKTCVIFTAGPLYQRGCVLFCSLQNKMGSEKNFNIAKEK